jgi:phenylalanyl-tRNA synthetase alpha chain
MMLTRMVQRMIPQNIQDKIGAGLLHKPGHPLALIKAKIEKYFHGPGVAGGFPIVEFNSPLVSTQANFDDLLIPKDHPSRAETDTFYKDENTVLRTHTSAHQSELIRDGYLNFIAFGDCYRKDTVDATHYPVFHQVEGISLQGKEWPWDTPEKVEKDLKHTLEGLVKYIFGSSIQIKWSEDYFPFTHPSWEMEICLNDRWLEILGCGIVHPQILANCGSEEMTGWAFGVGLERLAMILYQIPDIRLFWTDDERFHSQFKDGDAIFVPYSKHPPVYKDISFWVGETYHENQLHELAREVGQDLIEEVKLTDDFTHPKTEKN